MTLWKTGVALIAFAMTPAEAVNTDALFLGAAHVGVQSFDQTLDQAEADLKAGRYDRALSEFRKADAVRFPEGPNYEVLPAIAWLQTRLGQKAEAAKTIGQAELVLKVLIGQARCVEDAKGWHLTGDSRQVEKRMCSVFLDDYLHAATTPAAITAFTGRLHIVSLSLPKL